MPAHSWRAEDRDAPLLHSLVNLWKNEDGATVVEYGLVIAVISAAMIGGATQVSSSINAAFQVIIDTFSNINI